MPGAVAHAYNPSYLGDGDPEDPGLRAAWAKHSRDPISANRGWVWLCVHVIPVMIGTHHQHK
jgi:hypothetical protein